MNVNITNTGGTSATFSAGTAAAGGTTPASGGGGMTNAKLLEMLAKIIEKKDKNLEAALQTATTSDDKTAMLRATSAQGEQQAAFSAASNLVKGNNENMQTAARRS